MNTNLETALWLASANMHVTLCNPATKAPYLRDWPRRATNDPSVVREQFTRYPNAMPGIALGLCGLVAIDIDVKNGIDGHAAMNLLLDQYGELPLGPATKTPSGGTHYFCRQPTGRAPLNNATGALPCAIDIRGFGGQIIAPGAVRSDGTFYEAVPGWPDLCDAHVAGTIPEIPGWLVDIIERPKRLAAERGPSEVELPRTRALGDKSAWVAAGLLQEARTLAASTEGGRNNNLNRAVYTFAGHAANGWTTRDEVYEAMKWACTNNGYLASNNAGDGPKQFDTTFNSAWRSGIKLPTNGPGKRVDPACISPIKLTSSRT